MGNYKLVELVNGSFSVHSVAHEETFHPVVGPEAEAEALYVRQLRLPERIAAQKGEFVVWDVGLGSAANVVTLLRRVAKIQGELTVISFDQTLEPLRFALEHSSRLLYLNGYEGPLNELAAHGRVKFREGELAVDWRLELADFPGFIRTERAVGLARPHAILFDAYSPAKNPAMWTQTLFADLFRLLEVDRPCGLATYSRSTLLRVTLLLAGFYVGSGHATGEKEETTVAANRLELIEEPLDRVWLARARRSTSAEPLREAVYRQGPLSEENWQRLIGHPQFT